MSDSTRRKILDSALAALLKGFELSPWVGLPATFVAELSKRFRDLPQEQKEVLSVTTEDELRSQLPTNDPNQAAELADKLEKGIQRGRILDYIYGLPNPALDELVARVPAANKYVTKDAPTARKASELVEYAEAANGPGLENLPIPF